MLRKRFWIPILSVLVIAIGCGLFYGRKVAKQEPVTTIKPIEVEQPTTPKPPPPGETYETGHWHGDEWHANDAHAPAQPLPVESVPSPFIESPAPAPVAPQTPPETAPLDLKALESPMMKRYKRFQEIRETLPEDADMGDIVAASEFVPSQEELRAMSDAELLALRGPALKRAAEIQDEMFESWGSGERGNVIAYEWVLRRAPAVLASAEFERRYQTSFERLPPDQRFLTIISPKAAEELKKQLEERYEKQQEGSTQ